MRNRLIAGILFAINGLAGTAFVNTVLVNPVSAESIVTAPFAHFETAPESHAWIVEAGKYRYLAQKLKRE